MAEEFQESDVFWSEQLHQRENRLYNSFFQDENIDPAQWVINRSFIASASQWNSHQLIKKKSKQKNSSHSLPVNIPYNNLLLHYSNSNKNDDDLKEDAEMVPPHLIVADRNARHVAFSVCKGNGRSLRGRELRRVRNSILRMTGFLET
ncbi:hypothetical protein NE237_032128 [Protea cynaroides]|uniref:Uncharacterized protein n=1 Tax=Protea cynaroides TaxID=273540 RepID=A0A9Q0L3S7_9MAGN|nr:hypothetical protein NE237_032128 [Protea cynaroides]